MKALAVGSLFSGIGGLDLGFERAGFEVRWQVEIDDFCTRVLQKHWPQVPRYKDVRDVGAANLEWVDVIVGGFPCQDVSVAGKRAGLDGARSGLWSEFARVIGELRPRYALIENTPGLVSKGLDRVLCDLAAHGYDAEWQIISAAALGAPHLRERVFIVAHADHCGQRQLFQSLGQPGGDLAPHAGRDSEARAMAHPQSIRRGEGGRLTTTHAGSYAVGGCQDVSHAAGIRWGEGRPQPEVKQWCAVFSGASPQRSDFWAVEPGVGRVANGVPRRVDRLRGLGNAVVPAVAQYVAECVKAHYEGR